MFSLAPAPVANHTRSRLLPSSRRTPLDPSSSKPRLMQGLLALCPSFSPFLSSFRSHLQLILNLMQPMLLIICFSPIQGKHCFLGSSKCQNAFADCTSMLTVTSGYLAAPLETFICADELHQVFESTKISIYALVLLVPDSMFFRMRPCIRPPIRHVKNLTQGYCPY